METVPAQSLPALTRSQMREVDRIMVEDLGVSLLPMMEDAGRAVATVVREVLAGDLARRVVVLAGSGGNGGGALAAARRLHGWGADPTVVLTRPVRHLSGATGHQWRSLGRMGIPVVQSDPMSAVPTPAVIVDGVLGYGLVGAPTGEAARLIAWAEDCPADVVSVDTPSGLDVDTGIPAGSCVWARTTVTLAAPKVGLLTPMAAPYIGELVVADIGVPSEVYGRLGLSARPAFAAADLLRVARSRTDAGG